MDDCAQVFYTIRVFLLWKLGLHIVFNKSDKGCVPAVISDSKQSIVILPVLMCDNRNIILKLVKNVPYQNIWLIVVLKIG